jgi:hypothetical protein
MIDLEDVPLKLTIKFTFLQYENSQRRHLLQCIAASRSFTFAGIKFIKSHRLSLKFALIYQQSYIAILKPSISCQMIAN